MNALKIVVVAGILALAGCTSKSTCSNGVDDEITQIINGSGFYDQTIRTGLFKVAKVSSAEKTELGGVKCTAFLSLNGFQSKSLENSIKLEYEVTDTSVTIPGEMLDALSTMAAAAIEEFKLNPYGELDLTDAERLQIAKNWDATYINARKLMDRNFNPSDEVCSYAAEASATGDWGSAMSSCHLPAIF